jgi:hypothetical protein
MTGVLRIGIMSAYLIKAALINGYCDNVSMPPGFESVRLGMTLEEFSKLRPNVKPFSLFPDPQKQKIDFMKKNQMVDERLRDHPLFDYVMYQFGEGRLISLTMFATVESECFPERRALFLRTCVASWGKTYDRRVSKLSLGKFDYLAPLLYWAKDDIEIGAAFTVDLEGVFPQEGQLLLKISSQKGDPSLSGLETEPRFKQHLFHHVEAQME